MIRTVPLSLSMIFSAPSLGTDLGPLDEQKSSPDKKETSPPQRPKYHFEPPKALDLNDDTDPDRREGIERGRRFYQSGDFEKAHEWFELAAMFKGGSALGMYLFGSMYFRGEGTTRDVILGMNLLNAASRAGFHQASFDLGLRFFFGQDLPQSLPMARKYFKNLPHNNLKYRCYYGLCLYLQGMSYLEQILGLECAISAANDGYYLAQKVVRDEYLETHLSSLKYAYGKELYKTADTKGKIKGLKFIISAAQAGYESAQQDVESNNWERELAALEEAFDKNLCPSRINNEQPTQNQH